MSTDELLEAVASLQGTIDDEKAHLSDGLHLRLCNATQKVYDYAKALKRKETGGGASDEEEEEEEEEVRMVYTPGGPYYECSDGSYVRVWNNPHMLAQLAAGGVYNWRRGRGGGGAREGAHRG